VAFDVFLTEAQLRHATHLLRIKLREVTAERIRNAAAEASVAAENEVRLN
jgi:hypothetical protein